MSTDLATMTGWVERAVNTTPVFDMHTHLFPPAFGGHSASGIDALLTYHYLVAETLRVADVTPEEFAEMPQSHQAWQVWHSLFVARSPVSEAARGVLTVLAALKIPFTHDLDEVRRAFARLNRETVEQVVMQKAGVAGVVMTNDPLDPVEAAVWQSGEVAASGSMKSSLRLDRLVLHWTDYADALKAEGWPVSADAMRSADGIRKFVSHWIDVMRPVYVGVSLPDTYCYPDKTTANTVLAGAVVPEATKRGLPVALMLGVRRQVNPRLGPAGDGAGPADMTALERLCRDFPQTKFLVTVLARENQHALCVLARKFANLLPFGCWWFVNQPLLVEEILSLRLDMLGWSFVAQHSDARVWEQLLYKWPHFRQVLAGVLTRHYGRLLAAGYPLREEQVQAEVKAILHDNFQQLIQREPGS